MEKIQIINQKTKISDAVKNCTHFDEFIKGVADIKRNIIALGGELHADSEAKLVENGSSSNDIWGFNIYWKKPTKKIAFESLINIKPKLGNKSMEIADKNVREKVEKIIVDLIEL
ncbi:MAG: DUF5674 family protein [bacterium]|nr:DUF5674 family protein [bacterium]